MSFIVTAPSGPGYQPDRGVNTILRGLVNPIRIMGMDPILGATTNPSTVTYWLSSSSWQYLGFAVIICNPPSAPPSSRR